MLNNKELYDLEPMFALLIENWDGICYPKQVMDVFERYFDSISGEKTMSRIALGIICCLLMSHRHCSDLWGRVGEDKDNKKAEIKAFFREKLTGLSGTYKGKYPEKDSLTDELENWSKELTGRKLNSENGDDRIKDLLDQCCSFICENDYIDKRTASCLCSILFKIEDAAMQEDKWDEINYYYNYYMNTISGPYLGWLDNYTQRMWDFNYDYGQRLQTGGQSLKYTLLAESTCRRELYIDKLDFTLNMYAGYRMGIVYLMLNGKDVPFENTKNIGDAVNEAETAVRGSKLSLGLYSWMTPENCLSRAGMTRERFLELYIYERSYNEICPPEFKLGFITACLKGLDCMNDEELTQEKIDAIAEKLGIDVADEGRKIVAGNRDDDIWHIIRRVVANKKMAARDIWKRRDYCENEMKRCGVYDQAVALDGYEYYMDFASMSVIGDMWRTDDRDAWHFSVENQGWEKIGSLQNLAPKDDFKKNLGEYCIKIERIEALTQIYDMFGKDVLLMFSSPKLLRL